MLSHLGSNQLNGPQDYISGWLFLCSSILAQKHKICVDVRCVPFLLLFFGGHALPSSWSYFRCQIAISCTINWLFLFIIQMGERRDKAIKELRDQLAAKKQAISEANNDKQNFWETSSFKVVVSMSMLILVVFSKRWNKRVDWCTCLVITSFGEL